MNGSLVTGLAVLWVAITAVLAALLIYRALIGLKEDDQLFLSASESGLEKEQMEVQRRLARITPYTKILGAVSGILLICVASLWAYQQYTHPPIP
jgi:hypothetical protein